MIGKKKHSRFKIEKKVKISEENAVKIVTDFCQRYDIDPEPKEGEVNEGLETALDALTEYVSRGFMELKDTGKAVQHLQHPPGDVTEIEYNALTGDSKRAMDSYGIEENHSRLQAMMCQMAGLPDGFISKLSGSDLKVMETLATCFLL